MKANEVRLGNYFYHNGEIDTVNCNAIKYLFDLERTWVKPIPLTEEWLLKFGFTKKIISARNDDFGDDIVYELDERNFFLHYESSDFSISITYDRKDYNRGSCICPPTKLFRNVHQLQNLYFALTGEELTIKN